MSSGSGAQAQLSAAAAATGAGAEAAANALAFARQQFAAEQANRAPYMNAGALSTAKLLSLLGLDFAGTVRGGSSVGGGSGSGGGRAVGGAPVGGPGGIRNIDRATPSGPPVLDAGPGIEPGRAQPGVASGNEPNIGSLPLIDSSGTNSGSVTLQGPDGSTRMVPTSLVPFFMERGGFSVVR